MKIITLKEDEFDKFSKNHKYGNMYQCSSWGHLQEKNGYKLHFLGFKSDDNDLIGAAMVCYKEAFWGYKYAYAPGGLLIDYNDSNLIRSVSKAIKNLLFKQKFIFLKIDPPIVYNEKDENGNVVSTNNDFKNIFNTLKKCGFDHLGFNLYNESVLPRWNVYCKLDMDRDSFSDNVKSKLERAKRASIEVVTDNDINIDDFYEIIKPQFKNKKKEFIVDLFNEYNRDSCVNLFYGIIDSSKYVKNANSKYNKESEKNLALSNIIEKGDNTKYNLPKVINDKIESDKLLEVYKEDVVKSTDLLRKYPDGIICSSSLVIESNDTAHVYISYENKEYSSCNAYSMLISELYLYYSRKGFKYLDLGPISGNFDNSSKQYGLIKNKIGYNSFVFEFIGEFNLVINPIIYQVYKRKSKKK